MEWRKKNEILLWKRLHRDPANEALRTLGVMLIAILLYGASCVPLSAATVFRISSPAFSEDKAIPARYTCEGLGLVPPLTWTAPPAGTRSLALVMTDPDAPDPKSPRMTWVHWIAFDLPPSAGAFEPDGTFPLGGREGINSWKHLGYGGPCPPIGRHRYFFRLYALDTKLAFVNPPDRKKLLAAMRGHVLAKTVLMGTYQRRSH